MISSAAAASFTTIMVGSYSTDEFAQYVQESFSTVLEKIKIENDWNAENNYGL